MALIKSLTRDTRNVRPNRTAADCAYSVVSQADGTILLNLTSFGSESRKNVGEPSQSMQFTEETASQLLSVVLEVFPNLRWQLIK